MCERYINQLPLTLLQLGTWLITQACALTRNQTSDILVLRVALNSLSHASQGRGAFLNIANGFKVSRMLRSTTHILHIHIGPFPGP